MPHPNCYYDFIRDWPTNEGGVLISDPRLLWRIIPALEREEIRIGSFPHVIADVLPDMFLDLATVTAVWEEKHIAVARMHMVGVTRTAVRKSKQTLEKKRAESDTLKPEDYYSWRTFVSFLSGIYTRDQFDRCIREMRNGYFPDTYSLNGRPIRVTGCVLYIHAQTD